MENSLKMFINLGFHLKAIGTSCVVQNITTSLPWRIPLEVFHFSVEHAYLLICMRPPKALLTISFLTPRPSPSSSRCFVFYTTCTLAPSLTIKQSYWGTSLGVLLALEMCFQVISCCRRRPIQKTLFILFINVFCCQHHVNGTANQLLFQFLKCKTFSKPYGQTQFR